ncbi:uncharacterized protein N7515_009943 [Penicillium bovifimosum]|uniref:2EXR domain-containing protein n=1 Tax=Penicillium bovifimosum TaxID=126998 RepID=A0A9W9GHJ2_9EURO|nr:uncharacterized protein N7515_009943 [Penicillium bovifimosum]KAJ5120555.1 hypothetical protein N7515_009943 [Penicillium bovifimosum]
MAIYNPVRVSTWRVKALVGASHEAHCPCTCGDAEEVYLGKGYPRRRFTYTEIEKSKAAGSVLVGNMSCLNNSDFHHFPSLPIEIRLMVWEYTWPPPRVIEAVFFEVGFDDDDYEEFTILRRVPYLSF